ncbi:MAG TPA: hypothetical protein VD902_08570 [Symbiobacteriaceae bacterium]|nr:hypothetical protein [Symbiobacteriaceae bacterium]
MRDLSKLLSQSLKGWVEEGTCPAELLEQLEQSIRGKPRSARSWWQSWQVYAGAVAAAAVLLVVLTRGVDVSHQIASLPLVGTLAAQLLYPNSDVEGNLPTGTLVSEDKDGITLAVHEVTTGTDALRVQYSLRGRNLDTEANVNRYQALLKDSKGVLKIRRLHIVRAEDGVLLKAEYEPILPGQALTLTLPGVPQKDATQGDSRGEPWSVNFES